ncbi:MAG: NAD(P)/FAD-dependent oxidoreductase [Deltaproteobacteria bacterium]|nr:NAD(P)/FAD-dependent oxidoreductase [Deltaproteobacteria bacterium]
MKNHFCDILVIGAGPAGSSAALAAARKGKGVILVDRRPVVGVPVRCAEYIPALLMGKINTDKSFVVQSVRGMRTILPDGTATEIRAPGFTIWRDLFDQALAAAAKQAGVQLFLSTHAVSRNGNKIHLKGLDGTHMTIAAKVIIGADGPHTTVGKWIGSVNQHLIPAIQVRVPLIRPMDMTEIYFDTRIFGGYGWLFPKGKSANIGLGMKGTKHKPPQLKRELKRFISKLAQAGKIRNEFSGYTAGWIPANRPRKVVYENVLLVGDAAGHTHPITGAGIYPAVVCGQMAGKWAARAVESNNLNLLGSYEAQWRNLFEEAMERAYSRLQFRESNWMRLNEIIYRCWVTFRAYYE